MAIHDSQCGSNIRGMKHLWLYIVSVGGLSRCSLCLNEYLWSCSAESRHWRTCFWLIRAAPNSFFSAATTKSSIVAVVVSANPNRLLRLINA